MSDKDLPAEGEPEKGEPKPPNRSLTLEQALLAPLDSILKAQLHSARSFLNMLLQLGYPHQGDSDDDSKNSTDGPKGTGDEKPQEKKKTPSEPYHLEFTFKDKENKNQVLRIPALSLVPISPLAVDSANFELEMAANEVVSRRQIRTSESDNETKKYNAKKRPWFLVDEPLDIRGEIIAPTKSDEASKKQTESSIKIDIHVKSIPMPAGLNKLLTTLTAMGDIQELDDEADNEASNTNP